MEPLVLINPGARRVRQTLVSLKAAIADSPALKGAEIVPTRSAEEATRRAAGARDEGRELVVAGGGDGTVNAVVNGLLRAGPAHGGPGSRAAAPGGEAAELRPALAVLPLGTGNDLARSLGLPDDPREALRAVGAARRVPMDVIRVQDGDGPPRYCANVADGGFGGRVEEEMTDDQKDALGPLAYLRAAFRMITELQAYRVRLGLDGSEPRRVATYSVIVSNGRFAGGGVPVAPRARLDDGLLDVVVIPAAHFPDAGVLATLIAAGRHLKEGDGVHFSRSRSVEITSEPAMPYSVDGELSGRVRSICFRVVPGALRVLAGDGEKRAI